jgi:deoxyribonuclease V
VDVLSIVCTRANEVVKHPGRRYNRTVRLRSLHDWRISHAEAVAVQRRLAKEVLHTGKVTAIRIVAGVDVSSNRARGEATGAVVLLEYPGLEMIEASVVHGAVNFPYIPGLLSFREAPLVLAACEALSMTPDLILVDGQGIAHPRRIGLASHLGLILDMPTIGCAKSRLCGNHEVLGLEPGEQTDLVHDEETVGVVLRTRRGTKPVYVSVGHRIDLLTAVQWVLACCQGYRLPEPLRLAHQAAGGNLKPGDKARIRVDYRR